jgi:hypothetical protein
MQLPMRISGRFDGEDGKGDRMNWTQAAGDAWSLRYVPEALRAAASRTPVVYQYHKWGVSLSKFKYASA